MVLRAFAFAFALALHAGTCGGVLFAAATWFRTNANLSLAAGSAQGLPTHMILARSHASFKVSQWKWHMLEKQKRLPVRSDMYASFLCKAQSGVLYASLVWAGLRNVLSVQVNRLVYLLA